MATLKPASTLIISRSPMVDKDGVATRYVANLFQGWDTKLTNGLNSIGQITQDIPAATVVDGRSEGIGTTLQNIDSNGIILPKGIDFARPYLNKNTDNIEDGSGSPLAGGKAAEIALVSVPPTPEASKWVNGLVGGQFTKTQPQFSDISGAAVAAQLPSLPALTGQITEAQLPASGISVTIVTAPVTSGGVAGNMTFQNGILVGQVQAT